MPHGYLYIDNLKKVLKDTIYEKSRLWEYAKKYKNDNIDLRGLLSVAKYESFETLVEMKLYRLAEDARQFICKGSFKKIFGVDKTFYNFLTLLVLSHHLHILFFYFYLLYKVNKNNLCFHIQLIH